MKITLISDTHCRHDAVDVGSGDMIIHCGDSTIYGEEWEMKNFIEWFRKLPFKYKVFINGNHEVMVWKRNLMPKLTEELQYENCFYLENSGVEIEGLKLWGSPNTPEFFDWAYMYQRYKAAEVWANTPTDTEILITHGPPLGILDNVQPLPPRYPLNHAGCLELLWWGIKHKPKLSCFGHIHSGHGHTIKNGNLYVNAATCDDHYKPVYKPIVVDSETWKVVA